MKQTGQYKKDRFSIGQRLGSFVFAFQGIYSFFKAEHNAIVHLMATILVICMGFIFRVTGNEAIALALATGAVWAAELFNTAIERMADLITIEKHPSIKFVKDVSAAAVLVTALTAVCTGSIVFIPKMILLW